MSLLRRLAATIRRHKLEQEIDEEMRFHLEARAQLNMEEGQPVEEARSAALRQFGNTARQREAVVNTALFSGIEALTQDVSYAARLMRKNPAFSAFAILAMALGIGATTLMFSVVYSLLLKPLPYKDAGRLYFIWQKIPQENRVSFSTREFTGYQGQSAAFDKLAAYTGQGFVISGQGDPQLAVGLLVTPSFFELMGVAPELGQGFLESEGEPGHEHEVVLSHALWKERFSGSKEALGQTVVMNGEAYTVIGVMPASFEFPDPHYKLWVPAALRAPLFQEHADAHFWRVIGRLKAGAGIPLMQAEIATLSKRLNPDAPERQYYSVSLHDMVSGDLRRPLLVLLGAVGLLLMIACANVANMMLARATARRREMAVRAALGASRSRLVRQLLVESTLLSLIGGGIGLLLAYGGLQVLTNSNSKNIPELARVHIDPAVMGFVVLISCLAGILFGLAPALDGSQTDLQGSLKQSTQSSPNKGSERARSLLVFVEIALSSTLLIGSGLMLRSFIRLMHQDPGFAPEGLLSAQASLMPNRYPEADGMLRFYRNTFERLKKIPGVTTVGMAAYLPFGGNGWGNSFEVEGKPVPAGNSAQIRPVSGGYFGAMGIPMVRGREFTDKDTASSPGVAIINQVLARRFWPDEDPLGKRVRFVGDWVTIVGVCNDIKHVRLDEATEPEIYAPYEQLPAAVLKFVGRDQTYVVRAAVSSASAAASIRNAIHAEDPGVVVTLNSMQTLIDDTTAEPRFRTGLTAIFSGLALALAAVGIYGVLAYTVTQRLKELGIRIALGAQRADIRRLILTRALRLASLGIACGLLAAYLLSHFLRTLLFGIDRYDPVTFLSVPPFMLAIALLAAFLPAYRASKVSPTISLRSE